MSAQFDTHEDHIIVSRFRKLSYGIGNFGTCISENLVMTFAMTYYTVILKLDPVWVGFAFLWPRLYDAFWDPIMGQITDRTRSRWGRRRPYILFGSPFLALLTFLMFAPPGGASDRGLMVYLFIMSFVYYTVYTVVSIPYTALGAELSIDFHERTRVQTWRSVLMFMANLITPWTWSWSRASVFADERSGVAWVAAGQSVVILIGLWLCFAGTREEGELQTRENLPFWRAVKVTFSNKGFLLLAVCQSLLIIGLWGGFGLGSYVSIFYVFNGDKDPSAQLQGLGSLVFTPASLVGCAFWGWLGTRIGKKEGLLTSLITVAILAPTSWFFYTPSYPYLQLVQGGLFGFAFGALAVFPNAMVADLCDEDELKTNCRREGAYNGIISFVVKFGFSFTLYMTGLLLWLADFDEKLEVQPPETLTKLRLLFCVVPAAVMLVSAALIWFYPLNEKRVRQIRAVLEQRRAERLSDAQPGAAAGRPSPG